MNLILPFRPAVFCTSRIELSRTRAQNQHIADAHNQLRKQVKGNGQKMEEQEKTIEELNDQLSWLQKLSRGDEGRSVSSWRDVYEELTEKMEA